MLVLSVVGLLRISALICVAAVSAVARIVAAGSEAECTAECGSYCN